MAESKIEWTNKTWNPTTGCTSFSKLECDNCFARTLTNRYMHNPNLPKYHAGFDKVVMHESSLNEPYKWKKPTTIFVNSMSDLFHKDISLEFIKKVFKVMNDTPQHTYQVLTKRDHLLKRYSDKLDWADNIWMGVSVGMQASTKKIDSLRECGAKHKFLSVEPLIEEITEMDLTGIDLVLLGGESGNNSVRPMEKQWVINVKNICEHYKVPFFFKQWGMKRNNPDPNDPTLNKEHRYHAKGGSMLDGKLYLSNPSVSNDKVPTINLFGTECYIIDEAYDLNTIWELKSYLPMMENELLKQLTNDVKKNGVNDPILYWVNPEGKKLVIEGHTRLSAAISARKKTVPSKEIHEDFQNLDDIKLWMIKHQFQRRNLSSLERIELAFHSKETIEKTAKQNLSKAGKGENINNPIDTTAEIAKIAGVGRTTVIRYTNVVANASQTVLKKLKQGEISINAAYSSIKVVEPKKDIRKTQPPEITPVIAPSIEAAKELLENKKVEGILLIKDKSYINELPIGQKKKYAFVII
jgi:protein gp37/ParB-like chromosome segregation protein Spo0J